MEEGALNQNFVLLENYNMKRNDDTKEGTKNILNHIKPISVIGKSWRKGEKIMP